MAVLEVKNLYSGYGKIKVLFGINFSADEGKITAIIGPNGAGKSTLLNSIYGIADIYEGKVLLNGIDITGLKPYIIARMGIGYVPQTNNIFSELSVEENLRIAVRDISREEFKARMEEVLDFFPKLRELIHRKAGTLSGGERRMLAIAIALMRRPNIMLLDEVTTDLAPIVVKRILEKVVELRDKMGMTIVMVEQYARRALEICDKVYLIASGQVKFEGDPKQLLEQQELVSLYLGAL